LDGDDDEGGIMVNIEGRPTFLLLLFFGIIVGAKRTP